MSPLTSFRFATLEASGFSSEKQMGRALIALIERSTDALLGDCASLSAGQVIGIQRASAHTAATYRALRNLINGRVPAPATAEERDGLHFLLIKMMDDMMSLGTLTAAQSNAEIFSLLQQSRAQRARAGNVSRAEARHREMRKAILEEAGNVMLKGSDKFAQSIEDGVRRRLGVNKSARGFSRRNIQREVEAILQERSEDKCHS